MSPGFEMKKITGQGYLTCDELFASFQTHHEVHGLVKQMEKVGISTIHRLMLERLTPQHWIQRSKQYILCSLLDIPQPKLLLRDTWSLRAMILSTYVTCTFCTFKEPYAHAGHIHCNMPSITGPINCLNLQPASLFVFKSQAACSWLALSTLRVFTLICHVFFII